MPLNLPLTLSRAMRLRGSPFNVQPIRSGVITTDSSRIQLIKASTFAKVEIQPISTVGFLIVTLAKCSHIHLLALIAYD